MKLSVTLLAMTIAAAFAAPTLAQTPAPQQAQSTVKPDAGPDRAETTFAAIDKNQDGSLTMAEVKAADTRVTQDDFDKYDADKSKALSKSEFKEWILALQDQTNGKPG
ncbi:MAG: hypothetical protein R3C52_03700 [Hyphomonadaceae bacterium]